MSALSMAEFRKGFAAAIGRVQHGKERMIITRRDQPVAALVSVHDAALLQKLEDHLDTLEALEAVEDYEAAGGTSLRQLRADLDL